jgi:hypothetical protein
MDENTPTVPETEFPAQAPGQDRHHAPEQTRPAPPVPPQRTVPPYTPPPVSAAATRRGMGWRMGIALGLIAFLIGVGVAALLITRFGKGLNSGADGKQVATMTLPVSNGQPPVVILPGKAGAPGPAIDIAALSSREAELASKLDALEAREASIDRDAQQAAAYATRSEGLMVAFAARRALDRGLNLGFIEQQLRTRFGTTQAAAVATIVQAAHNPVTLEDLRAGLDGVAPELVTGVASSGWLQSLARELRNLVVLRKASAPSPLPVDRVARAQRLLEAGQVEAALAEVSRTPGASQATRWSEAARRYINTRHALNTIESAAILSPGVDPRPLAPLAPAAPQEPAPEQTEVVPDSPATLETNGAI